MENEYYVYIEKYNAMYGPTDLKNAQMVHVMTPGSIILKTIIDKYDDLSNYIQQCEGEKNGKNIF